MPDPIRLTVCQASLAKYRLPVWQALAALPDLRFTLHYSDDGHVPNVQPQGIQAAFFPSTRLLKRPELWRHPYFVSSIDPATCDACVLPWNTRFLSLYPAMFRARRRRVGLVYHGHGYANLERGLPSRLRDFTGRYPNAILVYSQRGKERLLARGYEDRRVFVAPNAVDQSAIARAREEWQAPGKLHEFQAARGLLPETRPPTLIFVARLESKRRIDLMLHAMAALSRELPSLRAIIIGQGDQLAPLTLLAQQLNLSTSNDAKDHAARVTFLGPIYDEPALAPWMLSADLMCFPSYIGLSLLHAFGYCLPVITSDNPAAHGPEFDALRDSHNGRTYREGSADDLARVLLETLRDRAALARMANHAHHTATHEFTLGRMVEGFAAAARFSATDAKQ